MEKQERAALQAWWFSWVGVSGQSVVWPMPAGWLGFWCTGYTSDDRATMCGWAEAEDEEALAAMVLQCWPEWDGCFRGEPRSVDQAWEPGSRFQVPTWSDKHRRRVAAALGVDSGLVSWARTGFRIRFDSGDAWWTFDLVSLSANIMFPIAGGEASLQCSFVLDSEQASPTSLERAVQRLKAAHSAAVAVGEQP